MSLEYQLASWAYCNSSACMASGGPQLALGTDASSYVQEKEAICGSRGADVFREHLVYAHWR